MGESVFVLDANVFIEASNRYYAFDLAPGFWDRLLDCARRSRLVSVDRVRDELERGADDLAEWVKRHRDELFASTDQPEVITSYAAIMAWVNANGQFWDAGKAEFAGGADGWLVAYAKATDATVVTHERFNAEVKRKVPIPNVCQAFGVAYVDTFGMLRALGVRFT